MAKFDSLALLGIQRPLVVEVLTTGYRTLSRKVDSIRINFIMNKNFFYSIVN